MQGLEVTTESLGPTRKKIIVTVPDEVVKSEINAGFKKLTETVELPGFRKGKVPVDVIKKKFADQAVSDAASKVIELSMPTAVKEAKLVPIDQPQYDLISLKEGESMVYAATFEVMPEIEVTGYKDIKVERRSSEVTEEEIDEALQRLREGRAEFRPVKRAAELSDMVMLDFDCFMDGKPVEDGNARDHPVVMGDTLLPGFDDALIGAKAGEERELDTNFPEKYHDKNLAGKAAHFKISVKSVRERQVPPFDNDLAKSFGLKTFLELKEKFTEELKTNKERQELDRLKGEAIDKLVEQNPFEMPEAIIKRYHASVLKAAEKMNKQNESSPPMTDEVKAQYRDVAILHAKRDVILDLIATKENIEVSSDDINEAALRMGKQRGEEPDRVIAALQREGSFEMLKSGIRDDKIFDMLLGASRQVKEEK